MEKFSRDAIKVHGRKRLVNSVKYAWEGIEYAFKHEQNLTIQVIVSILVLILGAIIGISRIEFTISVLMIGLVMGAELINTAIEAMLDVMHPEISPVVKVAKDTSAAAVLLFCLMSGIIGLMIYVPNIIKFIENIK